MLKYSYMEKASQRKKVKVKAYFYVFKDKELTGRHKVNKDVFYLGNSVNDDFKIESTQLSSKYARITLTESKLFIEDLSKSGIKINNNVLSEATLRSGDIIKIKDITLVLVYKLKEKIITEPSYKIADRVTNIRFKEDVGVPLDSFEEEGAFLVFLDPKNEGKRVKICKKLMIIGTGDVDVKIEDKFALAKHASLELEEDKIFISDLFTTSGTFVNDEKIKKRFLIDGDIIAIGNSIAQFKRKGKIKTEEVLLKEKQKEKKRQKSEGINFLDPKIEPSIGTESTEKERTTTTKKKKRKVLKTIILILILLGAATIYLYFKGYLKLTMIEELIKVEDQILEEKEILLEEDLFKEEAPVIKIEEPPKKILKKEKKKPKKKVTKKPIINYIIKGIYGRLSNKEKAQIKWVADKRIIRINQCLKWIKNPFEIKIKFNVNKGGNVGMINFIKGKIAGPKTRRCINDKIKNTRFPKSKSGALITYTYKKR